jgi:hypothetical protein
MKRAEDWLFGSDEFQVLKNFCGQSRLTDIYTHGTGCSSDDQLRCFDVIGVKIRH